MKLTLKIWRQKNAPEAKGEYANPIPSRALKAICPFGNVGCIERVTHRKEPEPVIWPRLPRRAFGTCSLQINGEPMDQTVWSNIPMHAQVQWWGYHHGPTVRISSINLMVDRSAFDRIQYKLELFRSILREYDRCRTIPTEKDAADEAFNAATCDISVCVAACKMPVPCCLLLPRWVSLPYCRKEESNKPSGVLNMVEQMDKEGLGTVPIQVPVKWNARGFPWRT